jgi:hypothetical protein
MPVRRPEYDFIQRVKRRHQRLSATIRGAKTSYCQVRLALGRIKVGGGEPLKESQAAGTATSDTALSSLLQILVDRLGADIVMVILLDEEMQLFLAKVGQDNSEPAMSPGWPIFNLLSLRVGCEISAKTFVLVEVVRRDIY